MIGKSVIESLPSFLFSWIVLDLVQIYKTAKMINRAAASIGFFLARFLNRCLKLLELFQTLSSPCGTFQRHLKILTSLGP